EVEVALLHVLAVVALGAREAEEALLQNGIAAVPEREREAQSALAIGDAEESVLAPPIGAAPRVIVREVVPRGAVRRVVFAHRAPLALGEVGPPALPILLAPGIQCEAHLLGGVWLAGARHLALFFVALVWNADGRCAVL